MQSEMVRSEGQVVEGRSPSASILIRSCNNSKNAGGWPMKSPIAVRKFTRGLSNSPHRKDSGVKENGNIHEKIAMLNVVEIVFDVLVDQVGTISTQLPQARDPRLHAKTLHVPLVI